MAAQRVVVIGAGAFGGWTALELRRRGARVTVIDAWGPGNARASSGGETRVIRGIYGARTHYTALAARSLQRWREFEAAVGRRIFHRTGALWLLDGSPAARSFAGVSADAVRAHGMSVHDLTTLEASRRYPQFDLADVATVMLEPEAGYLLARRACEDVIQLFESEGGTYRLGAASTPVALDGRGRNKLRLGGGTALEADAFIFACGPWLGSLFPKEIGRRVIPTRQEVYYFGTPPGDARFSDMALPVWIDLTGPKPSAFYGIPGNAHRGFKLSDDAAGPEMDPTTGEREPSAAGLTSARAFLARRFPSLASAPLLDTEVCQYEATPDSELIVDRHPEAENVWLVGGGSGHGFKLGPAVGELVASMVLGKGAVDPRYALTRFAAAPGQGRQEKWT